MKQLHTKEKQELCKKILLSHPELVQVGESHEVVWNRILHFLGFCDSRWIVIRLFIEENYPDLLKETYSPDDILKRFREVQKNETGDGFMSKSALESYQPALTETGVRMLF